MNQPYINQQYKINKIIQGHITYGREHPWMSWNARARRFTSQRRFISPGTIMKPIDHSSVLNKAMSTRYQFALPSVLQLLERNNDIALTFLDTDNKFYHRFMASMNAPVDFIKQFDVYMKGRVRTFNQDLELCKLDTNDNGEPKFKMSDPKLKVR
jgi:hypothetical protein